MTAEMIIISGPSLGDRYLLDADEIRIRAVSPASSGPNGPPMTSQCVVRREQGRYRIIDQHRGEGTYVNGLRVTEHWLKDGDQVSVGENILVFREHKTAEMTHTGRTAILRSCAILFLFRALAAIRDEIQQTKIEEQIIELLRDFTGSENGVVVLGKSSAEIQTAATERGNTSFDVERITTEIFANGIFFEEPSRTLGAPVLVHGKIAGVIAVRFGADMRGPLEEKRDTLSGVATLAGFALESAQDISNLRMRNALLQEELAGAESGIVGDSAVMKTMMRMIDRVAPQDTTVLVTGESGTGKELIARALHNKSRRREKPFVAINCAVLTENLLESELFGHEKGSFTGAVAQKKGKLEVAEGGTVFLDEIGELAPGLQAKLLRVLQEREFERLGGTRTLRLDVRLIAATNRDLKVQVQRGGFRDDLYHRLNVISIKTPPLRERSDDILPLANYFLQRSAVKCGRAILGISPEAQHCLTRYLWPGNVRELENAIERAVVLGESEWLMPEDFPDIAQPEIATKQQPAGHFTATISDA